MIKTSLFTFLLAFAWNIGFAQTKEVIDSLHHQLAIAKDDTSKVGVLTYLCLLYRLGNADSSLLYGQQALQLAQQINYSAGEVWSLSFMSLTMAQLGNYPKTLEMAFRALQIAESNHFERETGAALNAIGETYTILKDYPKALYYFRKQKAITEHNSTEGLAYALKDIGEVFKEMNQLDSAIYYEQQAIITFHKMNREEPQVYESLGDIKVKSGEHIEALNFYQKALQISLISNERRGSAGAYNKIASVFKVLSQTDSSIYYAKKGLDESKLISQKKTILEAAALLSSLYESIDPKESLRYLKIADAYKDSLFGAGNLQAVQTLVIHEEKRQKEIEATKVAYQNQLKQYALMASLAILFLVAFFLYRNNQKEKKAKNLLQNKNELIEQTLNNLKATQSQLIQSEKMASLGELTAGIAHEIQNPLNFVNNFSEVNKELLIELKDEIKKGNFEEVDLIANDIEANEDKINYHGKRAGAIVKGMLQHSQTSTGKKEPTDINKLADEYLRLSYHGLLAKDKTFNATLKTGFDETLGNINVIPQDIGRVILNLINNAFYVVGEKKKSGIEGYEPTVSVITKKIGDKVEIKVADNGNGISQKIVDKIFQPFFTTKPTGQGTGLGLSLSYDIIKAHGGQIKVESKEGEGSEFKIQLPII